MIELDRNRPAWPQIVEVVKERIIAGMYEPGERVPSVLALAEEFGVTSVTVRKAIKALREDHFIRTEMGMGSYVLTGAERDAANGSEP